MAAQPSRRNCTSTRHRSAKLVDCRPVAKPGGYHFDSGLAILAAFVFMYGIVAAKLEKTPVSGAIVFVFFGLAFGPIGLGITDLDVDAEGIRTRAELTQAVSVLAGVVGVIFVGLLVAVWVRALNDAVEETRHPKKTKQTHENDP